MNDVDKAILEKIEYLREDFGHLTEPMDCAYCGAPITFDNVRVISRGLPVEVQGFEIMDCCRNCPLPTTDIAPIAKRPLAFFKLELTLGFTVYCDREAFHSIRASSTMDIDSLCKGIPF